MPEVCIRTAAFPFRYLPPSSFPPPPSQGLSPDRPAVGGEGAMAASRPKRGRWGPQPAAGPSGQSHTAQGYKLLPLGHLRDWPRGKPTRDATSPRVAPPTVLTVPAPRRPLTAARGRGQRRPWGAAPSAAPPARRGAVPQPWPSSEPGCAAAARSAADPFCSSPASSRPFSASPEPAPPPALLTRVKRLGTGWAAGGRFGEKRGVTSPLEPRLLCESAVVRG